MYELLFIDSTAMDMAISRISEAISGNFNTYRIYHGARGTIAIRHYATS
jgi:hypothetical protein